MVSLPFIESTKTKLSPKIPDEEPNPSLMKQIPQDIFNNVISKYLPLETFQAVSRYNKELRTIYVESMVDHPDVWSIAIGTEDLELLRCIRVQPPIEDLRWLFEDALFAEPEFLYVLLQRCTEEDIKDATVEAIFPDLDNGRYLAQAIVEKPKLLDFFLPFIAHLISLYDDQDSDITLNVFALIKDKIGYIPKTIFDNYIGAIVDDCYIKHHRDRTGDRISTLLADPSSSINAAMKLFVDVR